MEAQRAKKKIDLMLKSILDGQKGDKECSAVARDFEERKIREVGY